MEERSDNMNCMLWRRTARSAEVVVDVGDVNFGSPLLLLSLPELSSQEGLLVSKTRLEVNIVDSAFLDPVGQFEQLHS